MTSNPYLLKRKWIEYITEDGEPATLEQKERMWLKYGNGNPDADMPLILDDECA